MLAPLAIVKVIGEMVSPTVMACSRVSSDGAASKTAAKALPDVAENKIVILESR